MVLISISYPFLFILLLILSLTIMVVLRWRFKSGFWVLLCSATIPAIAWVVYGHYVFFMEVMAQAAKNASPNPSVSAGYFKAALFTSFAIIVTNSILAYLFSRRKKKASLV